MATTAATAETPLELPFVTLDVFTTTRFKGNPLAVVTIPANLPAPPTQEQKQAIAREFNLSETVFVHDVDPTTASDHDVQQRKIDIFLTNAEIPFAGHPTIGAAVSLLPLGVRTVVAKAGPIEITQTGPRAVEATIPHDVHLHAKRPRDLPGLSLSSDPAIRQAELDAPLFSIVNGMTFLLVELPSLELLARVQATPAMLPADKLLDEGWRKSFVGKYHFVRTDAGSGPSSPEGADHVITIRTRLVESSLEDPATGSAASALCSYLSLYDDNSKGDDLTRYVVTQGVEMGRESNILISVATKDKRVETVKLSGTATQVMRGFVTL
ncbi:phenazine biosynthesis-like protein [Sarocladium implicatum]|nr:phenazine biosynthesis-like protein [Sarocladium implicatum]